MSRSVWKGPFVDSYVLKKAEKSRESGRNEVIKIWSRRSTILPQFVGLTFGVYNGRKHIPVNVSEDMIGQKFGEYSPTRTYYGHAADKKPRGSKSWVRIKIPAAWQKTKPWPNAHASHLAAETEPGGRDDPRQEGRQGACRSDLLEKADLGRREESAFSRPSPTPRTTMAWTSTNWSSPRPMSART